MLKQVDLNKKTSKKAYKAEADELANKLISLQRQILAKKIPVMISLEGWSGAGKGQLLNELCLPLDPRGFKVYDGRSSKKTGFGLSPFWQGSPAKGFISLFSRSWYREAIEHNFKKKAFSKKAIEEARNFERLHKNSGTLVLKFFIHISEKEQAKRLKSLSEDKNTKWRVKKRDWQQNSYYDEFREASSFVISQSSEESPWIVIAADDLLYARIKLLKSVIEAFEAALSNEEQNYPAVSLPGLPETSPLKDVDLSLSISRKTYKDQFKALGEELQNLGHRLFKKKIPLVMAFEGWDAAGKGGSIRRLTSFFDPRTYTVCPVSAPSTLEKSHQYLWRFMTKMPNKGDITVFDRSWYGRVMVEQVEGFCGQDEWQRAYDEINEMEKSLVESGVILLKFWFEISQEEQMARFQSRLETPHKTWKITDEDWRNREKWPQYEVALHEMISRTHTKWAPWTIVEGNDKPYARIKTMKAVCEELKKYV